MYRKSEIFVIPSRTTYRGLPYWMYNERPQININYQGRMKGGRCIFFILFFNLGGAIDFVTSFFFLERHRNW